MHLDKNKFKLLHKYDIHIKADSGYSGPITLLINIIKCTPSWSIRYVW